MTKDEEFLIKRIEDLAERADRAGIVTHTNFLTPLEQDLVLGAAAQKSGRLSNIRVQLWGGRESCIRRAAVLMPMQLSGKGNSVVAGVTKKIAEDAFADLPISILHVTPMAPKFAEDLTHRDYLGALMGLGMDRSMTGDIVVRGKEAYIYVLDPVVELICDQLTQVRRTNVQCAPAFGDIPDLEIKFQTVSANIASPRMDLLIGIIAGGKRDAARNLLNDRKVFVNGRLETSPGRKLKEGDEIIVRGFGKFIYDGITGQSRKGRSNVELRRYE